jgi:hypothetical protein
MTLAFIYNPESSQIYDFKKKFKRGKISPKRASFVFFESKNLSSMICYYSSVISIKLKISTNEKIHICFNSKLIVGGCLPKSAYYGAQPIDAGQQQRIAPHEF